MTVLESSSSTENSLGISRYFSNKHQHPYDELEWEKRHSKLINYLDGSVVFELEEAEFPLTWSMNATNIVAQKYFRDSERTGKETSLKTLINRVADTISQWGLKDGYFDEYGERVFNEELKYILVNQMASFNSPVWFNIGVPGAKQQASACFILDVEDDMESILNWYKEEGIIFKGGSGAGVNLSKIRSSKEALAGGGIASGPVSFMRGADASAGAIKSGGTSRRSAKMSLLDVTHPDIEEFIWTKAKEELKIRALADAGFDMGVNGKDMASVQFQNANNSIRVTDEFMDAVINDEDWELRSVTTGEVIKTVKAKELFRQAAQAAWECADPGIQFDTIINDWHTAANHSRIEASNPCFTGDMEVLTELGYKRFDELFKLIDSGSEVKVATHNATNLSNPSEGISFTYPEAIMCTGENPIVRLTFTNGKEIKCTPNHAFFTRNSGYVEAKDLTQLDELIYVDNQGISHETKLENRKDLGTAVTYNLTEPSNHSYIVNGVVVRNCSEYLHVNNSACNLASINLLKFFDYGVFNVDSFEHTVEIMFIAQDILVGNADYPTPKITENTLAFRQLGLGYANLGALLMANGLPYDSREGRSYAGAITSLMTSIAYLTSTKIAEKLEPFPGYEGNKEHMLNVLDKHKKYSEWLPNVLGSDNSLSNENYVEIYNSASSSWKKVVENANKFGVRNAQATVLAPTGTIGLMMDCDTTGVEPDLALFKHKNLVGGGSMSIINQTIPLALEGLDYDSDDISEIIAYLEENKTLIGAPNFHEKHLPVFATSMGDNVIHHYGHVDMMASIQPFISGAISKTVNMPEEATVEDVEDIFMRAWTKGVKALAIYRDNCKVGQPLSSVKKEAKEEVGNIVNSMVTANAERERLPRNRNSKTFEFRLSDLKGFVTVGEYPDGRPGELFIKVSKQGSTLAGIMDAFAISISHGLQYGVPLRAFIEAFIGMRFEPAGMTDDPDVRIANSLVDYLFRRLALYYLPYEDRYDLGIFNIEERKADVSGTPLPEPTVKVKPSSYASDAPLCLTCGEQMQRSGSCHVCSSCGSTSGCS